MKVVGRLKNRDLVLLLVGHKHSSNIRRVVLEDTRACCRRTRVRDMIDDVMMNENIVLEIQFWQSACECLCNGSEVCCRYTLASSPYRFFFSSSTILTTHALSRREVCCTFMSTAFREAHRTHLKPHAELEYLVNLQRQVTPCSSIRSSRKVPHAHEHEGKQSTIVVSL